MGNGGGNLMKKRAYSEKRVKEIRKKISRSRNRRFKRTSALVVHILTGTLNRKQKEKLNK